MLEQQTYSWSRNLRVLFVASLVNSGTLKMYPTMNAATSWNINPHRYLHVDATSRDVRRLESFHTKKAELFHQLPTTQKTEEPKCTASPTSEPHIPYTGLCALCLSLQRSVCLMTNVETLCRTSKAVKLYPPRVLSLFFGATSLLMADSDTEEWFRHTVDSVFTKCGFVPMLT